MYNHGAIITTANCIPGQPTSSNDAETWGLAALQATGIHLRNIFTEWGKPPHGPIPTRVDNSITGKQAREECAVKNARHAARRIAFIQHNEQDGIFATEHVHDAQMPADFLTKWVPIDKYRRSRDFIMNKSAQVQLAAP